MNQLHLFISGYVHSVGFRRFIQREAVKRGLTGWVRNLADRRVEAVLQGEKDKLEEVILLCKKGPMMAEVKSVNVMWQSVEGKAQNEKINSFEILGTK